MCVHVCVTVCLVFCTSSLWQLSRAINRYVVIVMLPPSDHSLQPDEVRWHRYIDQSVMIATHSHRPQSDADRLQHDPALTQRTADSLSPKWLGPKWLHWAGLGLLRTWVGASTGHSSRSMQICAVPTTHTVHEEQTDTRPCTITLHRVTAMWFLSYLWQLFHHYVVGQGLHWCGFSCMNCTWLLQ